MQQSIVGVAADPNVKKIMNEQGLSLAGPEAGGVGGQGRPLKLT
jgi:hypothetical protein